MRKFAASILLALGLMGTAFSVPAFASTGNVSTTRNVPVSHAGFAFVDNNGVPVARAVVCSGEELEINGRAYLVGFAHRVASDIYEFTLVPGLPVSDYGKTLFATPLS